MKEALAERKGEEYKPSPIETMASKYSINAFNMVLTQECWYELFDKGYLSQEVITQNLEKTKYCEDETTPDWVKLWHYNDLEDEEFELILDKIDKQWKKRDFINYGVILHIVGLRLHLSRLGLYENTPDEILSESKNYIVKLKDDNKLEIPEEDIFDGPFEWDSWGSLGYAGLDMDEFKGIIQFMKETIRKIRKENQRNEAENLLVLLARTPEEFGKKLLSTSDQNTFYDVPVFQFIKPKRFLGVLLKLKNKERRKIALYIKERYKSPHSARRLVEEIVFLKGLDLCLSKEEQKTTGKMTKYVLSNFRKSYLSNAIKSLNVQIEQDS
jgi:hypothetical protein